MSLTVSRPVPAIRFLRFVSWVAVALALGLLSACGGGGGGDAPPPPPAAPAVTSVSPTSLVPPGQITVNGSALDRVSAARLGATSLSIASQSATALVLNVPAGASTDFLTLVDSAGAARQTAQQITVLAPMTIATLSSTSLLTGSALTLTGTGLDRATTVEFSGGAQAAVTSRVGSTSVTVDVPTAAQSGVVSALSATGERAASATALTVIPRIVVSNAGSFTAASGSSVTLSGSGFGEISSITVGGVTATLGTRSATQISFTVPGAVSCGPVTLQSASQPPVSGGTVVASGGCLVRVESIEFAQVMSQPSSDARQRLVPQRETWVRAYVVSSRSGVSAPPVRLTAYNGTTVLGSVTMTGPQVLPQLTAGSTPDAALRNDGTLTFNGRIDEAWTGSGLRVEVSADPGATLGAPVVVSSVPTVGTTTAIDVVLVPLVSGDNVPTIAPDAVQQVLDEITRRMPVARGNIQVSVRAPYTLNSVTDGVDTSGEWTAAVSELETLRRTEAPTRQYYGLVKPMVASGTAGIGYVNTTGASAVALSSMGWDSSRSTWLRTMTHEFGHNYTRRHAPCGGVGNPDASYPYAGGLLGATPLFDVLADAVVSPVSQPDVMGYCSGRWFSDYNLREIQRFLEWRSTSTLIQKAETSADESDASEVLHVSGRIGLDGTQLDPVLAARGRAVAQIQGDYLLRLRTAAGGVFEVPFDAVLVDHAMPPQKHFNVSVPNPGPLAAIEIVRGGNVIASRMAGKPDAEVTRMAAGKVVADLQEAAGLLTLTWDAARYPHAMVTHVVDGKLQVLALRAQGGRYSIDSAQLTEGGRIELGLSDGLNTAIRVLAR
jgi:hypothetical protein